MYIVITGEGENETIMERKLSAAEWDETVLDIARGEWTDVSSVIQTSTGFDVLSSMASQVMAIWAEQGAPYADWQREFIKQHRGPKPLIEIDLQALRNDYRRDVRKHEVV